MRPLPYVWPYWLVFWSVFLWAYLPESRIVRKAGKEAKRPGSQDAGSTRVIILGMGIATFAAFPLAWVRSLRFPPALDMPIFMVGVATLIAGSLLRRHCWRMLGGSFTGDVQAKTNQQIVTRGAYRLLRHPSYTAGILMNAGMGLALGSWASTILVVVGSAAAYGYRIRVEERALLSAIGEPYREFLRTRKRLIPYVY